MIYISYIIGFLVYLTLSIQSGFTLYENLSISLFCSQVLIFIHNLGRKIVILDIIILTALFSYLIMPIAGYHHFDRQNYLASMWIRYMPVQSNTYFSFMFPSVVALIAGLKLPIFFTRKVIADHRIYLQNIREYLQGKKWEGLVLIGLGTIGSFFQSLAPSEIAHVFFLLGYLLIIGAFYCFYSDFPMKKLVLWGVFLLLIFRSVVQGMFGEMIFMGVMTMILISLGLNVSYFKKLFVFIVGIFFILIIQVVKPEYREKVWFSDDGKGDEISVFFDIVGEKLNNPSALFANEIVWFNFYSRFNQGLYVGLVQKNVPARLPYAEGETINNSILGAIVPRVLWPSKQSSGGVFNFKRFLGINLRGYSVGISPFGEAWGNYGASGGIIFMFIFGLMFNFVFSWILKIAIANPSIILWLPLMFFYAVKIETDVFSMVNSLFKACMFTFIMFKLYPIFFRGRL